MNHDADYNQGELVCLCAAELVVVLRYTASPVARRLGPGRGGVM